MLKLLGVLFDILDKVGQYLANKQLLDAGKAQQQVVVDEKVEANVEQAKEAVTVPDAARTERLRARFDDANDK